MTRRIFDLMRMAFAVCVFLGLSLSALGGEPGKNAVVAVEGKVVDAENAEALTGASIHIVELDLTAFASFDGSYSFSEIPAGVYTVEVSYIGFSKVVYEGWEVKEGKVYKKFYL
jgi:hypothetical protein